MNSAYPQRSDDTAPTAARVGAWTRYWATGARHACAGSFTGHYGDATAEFWQQRFRGLKATDKLLELGCGNGSLIQFLAEVAPPQLPQSIAAVDAAQIEQSWVATLPPGFQQRLALYPSTPAEALPFAEHTVTHLCSQYAMEYFAKEALWQELQRVLSPQACISAICHHADSLLSEVARAESAHCDWLLARDGVLDRAQTLLPIFFDLAIYGPEHLNQNPQAKVRREEFNQVLMALEERARSHRYGEILHDVAQQVMQVLNMASVAGNRDKAVDAFSSLQTGVQDSRLRASELLASALTTDDVEVWTQQLHLIGLQDVAFAELYENSHLFGWKLIGS